LAGSLPSARAETGAADAAAVDALALLQAADRARGDPGGIVWEVTVVSRDGGDENTVGFAVSARGFDLLAVYTTPPRQKDARLLMVKRNMWFSRPGLSKPVPISPRQRLLGDAAYGDIAGTDYAGEYDATAAAEETVDGEACHVFDLKAKSGRATYDRIRYWVSKERRLGVQAHYFTVSGKRLKTARMEYANTVAGPDGAPRPFISRLTIRDALLGDRETEISFGAPAVRPLPDSLFDLNLMTR